MNFQYNNVLSTTIKCSNYIILTSARMKGKREGEEEGVRRGKGERNRIMLLILLMVYALTSVAYIPYNITYLCIRAIHV